MELSKKITIGVVGLVIASTVSIGICGTYFGAKVLSKETAPISNLNNKNSKTINKVDNPEDFGPYMRNIQRKIKMNWNPPKNDNSSSVTLLFTLDRKGNVVKHSFLESSNDKKVNKAAVDALLYAQPFGELPKTFKGQSVDVQFKFDYNIIEKTTK